VDEENPLSFSQIEEIIRQGDFLDWDPVVVRLRQIGDAEKRRPEITEFNCEMDGGLLSIFRADEYGIPETFTRIAPDTHSKRQQAAFAPSHLMGLNLVPFGARREHPTIGSGSLTAMIEGISFIYVDRASGWSRARKIPPRKPTALAEAYVHDFVIGSGHRIDSSYIVTADGLVRSQDHHEAFSWTQSLRLMEAFTNTSMTVSEEFWELLRKFGQNQLKQNRLEAILQSHIGDQPTKKFFKLFDKLLTYRRMGDHAIHVR
jgi:hypothetical protein